MYSSLEDLQARLAASEIAALSDDDNDGEADEAVIEAAIADADAEINAWLAPRYAVPFATVPALVCFISATLAIERLYGRRRETPSADFKALAAEARELLISLSSGEASLADPALPSGRPISESTTRGEEKVFSQESLKKF